MSYHNRSGGFAEEGSLSYVQQKDNDTTKLELELDIPYHRALTFGTIAKGDLSRKNQLDVKKDKGG